MFVNAAINNTPLTAGIAGIDDYFDAASPNTAHDRLERRFAESRAHSRYYENPVAYASNDLNAFLDHNRAGRGFGRFDSLDRDIYRVNRHPTNPTGLSPQISNPGIIQNYKTAGKLWTFLDQIRQLSPDPQFERRVRLTTMTKFLELAFKGKPIVFTFPGFPAKSPNHRTKVLGPHPDLGEVLALRRLDRLVRQIGEVYGPGAQIKIISDGRIFADVVGLADDVVDAYLCDLRRMCPNPAIQFVTIDDYYSCEGGAEKTRCEFLRAYAPSEDEIRASIDSDPERRRLWMAFTRFRKEDRPSKFYGSCSQFEKVARVEALRMIQRNDASARFIAAMFPGWIRLSIHPQGSNPRKIGINLLPSEHCYSGTPWHLVTVVLANGNVALMKRREAEVAGYELVYRDGKPYCYKECGCDFEIL